MHLSVIVPVRDDAGQLARTLPAVRAGEPDEIVVVDGDSGDGVPAVAGRHGARLITSPPGRAVQLNRGARSATGDTLLFLHADTEPPAGYRAEIERVLARPGVAAGAFRLRIDAPGRLLRWVERGVRLRCRLLAAPYGDQGLFLHRATWERVGGYPELPVMEDFAMLRRLRREGTVALSPRPALTCARSWRRRGVLRTTALNQLCIAAYLLGVPPRHIARWRSHGHGGSVDQT